MNEMYEKLCAADLWRISRQGTETKFDVSEAWLHKATGQVTIEQFEVDASTFRSWLENEHKNIGAENESYLLQRLVWLDVDAEKRSIKLTSSIYDQLITHFGLNLANKFFTSYITGLSSVPADCPETHTAFTLSYAPKFAALWCEQRFEPNERPPVTRTVMFVPDAEKKAARKFLNSKWDPCMYYSYLFPLFLWAIQFEFQIDQTQATIREGIKQLEGRTGYHTFANREKDAAVGELGPLAARASGYATKLASVDRKTKVVENIIVFLQEQAEKADLTLSKNDGDWVALIQHSFKLLRHHIGVLSERSKMQALDSQYTQTRVQIQIQALSSLITQNDSLTSIHQARLTQALAEASYRDSSSMKTLAIVTMFFLPGSFISAIFSMPMFEWDQVDKASSSIGVGLLPQFNLYWAITVPLTIATFALYFSWLLFLKREAKNKTSAAEGNDSSAPEKGLVSVESTRLAQWRHRETSL